MKVIVTLFLVACYLVNAIQSSELGCRIDRQCSAGWVRNGHKCYKLLTTPKSFDDADASCKTNDAGLVSIGSGDEHRFLIDFILRDVKETELKSVWIGGRRKKFLYIWLDLELFKYFDWHSANTDLIKNDINSCVQLLTSDVAYNTDQRGFGKFLVQPCATKNYYICQKQAEIHLPPMRKVQ